MRTVFQAFFTSYLVEPGYGKKFETFDDLVHSSVAYGYNGAIEILFTSSSYADHLSFPTSRCQNCHDIAECRRRIANNDQSCILTVPRLSQYLASEMGILDATKSFCTLENSVFTTGVIFLLHNGSPFLNRLNELTRRSLEGGLLGRYWAQLLWMTSLKSKMRFGNGK